jgi:hypothetical protein
LAGYCEWDNGHLLHANLAEWGPGTVHHTPARAQARGSATPMLFVLVMDILNLLIAKAAEMGLLQPLSSRNLQHRISIYIDDVVVRNRTLTLIEREDDTRSWGNFLVYFSHNAMPT